VLVQHDYASEVMAAEVDSEKQRYSAARYVQMQRDVFMGVVDAMDAEERAKFERRRVEFMRYIHRLAPDEQTAFWAENDELISKGDLWVVPTPEEAEEARQRVLARIDEIRADAARPMFKARLIELDPALRNALALDEDRMPTDDEMLGLPGFPELGDDEDGEEEEQDEVEG
jgi:hypothetical protein